MHTLTVKVAIMNSESRQIFQKPVIVRQNLMKFSVKYKIRAVNESNITKLTYR